MNRKAIQKDLDLAAAEFDKKGWKDLADKVDRYSSKLVTSKDKAEISMIGRALERVNREADRRSGKSKDKDSARKQLAKKVRDRKASKRVPLRLARMQRLRKTEDEE